MGISRRISPIHVPFRELDAVAEVVAEIILANNLRVLHYFFASAAPIPMQKT
jgi:hypothetical protein